MYKLQLFELLDSIYFYVKYPKLLLILHWKVQDIFFIYLKCFIFVPNFRYIYYCFLDKTIYYGLVTPYDFALRI